MVRVRVHDSTLCPALLMAFVLLRAPGAGAEPTPPPASTRASPPSQSTPPTARESGEQVAGRFLRVRAGGAYFLHARSSALPHRVKPAVHVAALWPLLPRLDVGAAASGVVGSSNYGVWAAYCQGRYRLVDSSWQLGASLGLGVGHDAPILHSSLETDGSVLPYALLGVDVVFSLSDHWRLGFEIADEQLSVLHFGTAMSYEY